MTKRAFRKSIESEGPELAGRAWLVWWLQERRRRRVAASVPVVPAPLDLIASDLGTYIEVGWTIPEGDFVETRIYRKVNEGSYNLYIQAGVPTALAEDHGVSIGSAYRYYATMYSALGESVPSNEALVVFGS